MNDNNDQKPSLSNYFGDSAGGASASLSADFFDEISEPQKHTPITPIDNTLANIGYLHRDNILLQSSKDQDSTLNQDFMAGKHSINQTTASPIVAAEIIKRDNNVPLSSLSLGEDTRMAAKPYNALPDPSTFFDNIGPGATMTLSSAEQPTDKFMSSVEFSTDKLSPPDTQFSPGEADRRRDAWIPTEDAKRILLQAQTSSAGSFFPEREVLTMPGVVLEEDLGDVLYDVVSHYLGEGEAVQRGSLGCEHVTQDERGLRELIQAGCFRTAVNLTTRLLTIYGQGVGKSGHPGKHSPRSLQLWFTRLALLVKIHSYSLADLEAEPFGSLENPDIYFQFYPDMYNNRSGSMASFSFRLLLAELPIYSAKCELAIARLHVLLAVVRKMIKNLKASKCELGSDLQITPQDRQESLKLWSGREARIQFSVVNCALQMKDYSLAMQIVEGLAESPVWAVGQSRALRSALGRCCLQAGHIPGAEAHFRQATAMRASLSPDRDVRELVDQSLLAVAQNAFSDAHQCLVLANQLEPANIMVLNNMAVCLLYSGKLKEAIAVMENAVNSNPSRGLSESLLLNLCTLYELESSNTMTKKLALLRQLCRYKSDTVTNVPTCLKLHM